MRDVVLIPGVGSDVAVWARTIAKLGDDASCTIGDTLRDTSLRDMADRILAAAPPRFALAGVSMGGMVALEIMRAAPSRVAGLAIIDSNAFPDTPEQAEQRRRMIATLRAGVDLRVSGQASLAWLVHPDADASIKSAIVEMGVRIGAQVYAQQVEAVLSREDQQSLLKAIDIPTFVVTGAEDAMIPVSCAQAIHASIPNSILEVIPSCGHLPPIERPQIVANLLRRLLARCRSHQGGCIVSEGG